MAQAIKKQVKKKKREKKEKHIFLNKTTVRASNEQRCRSRLRK